MSCLAWNCCEAGNATTVRDLCALVKETSSQIVFLCETRQKVDKLSRLCKRLGLRGCAGIDSDGLSGGLALFWHESVSIDIKDMNERYIDAYVCLSPDDPLWHVTFVYGEPRAENRHRMWSMLNTIRQSSNLSWLVMGDFNEALWQFEHFSKKQRSESQMQAFRNALQICELQDLGFKGLPHTYDNRRDVWSNVKVRLDRAVANDRWRDIFTAAQVVHMVSPCLDHCPILMNFQVKENLQVSRKCLHYEIIWEREPEISQIVEEAWSIAGGKGDLGEVSTALAKVMSSLKSWSNRKVKNVGR